MYRLVFLTGRMKGRRLAVQQGSLLIGRSPECQIDLADDDEVSHQHAVIEQRSDGLYIKDLGATNPMEINGKPVLEGRLRHGDKIEIGRTVMQFQLVESYTATLRRKVGPLHVFTFLLMGLLLVAQAAYWLLFPVWQARTAPTPFEQARKPRAAPDRQQEPKPAPAADTIEDELQKAIAAAGNDSSAVALSPGGAPAGTNDRVLMQVASLREDVAQLRKEMESITGDVPVRVAAEPVEATPPPQPPPAPVPVAAPATAPPPPAPAPMETNVPAAPPAPAEDPVLAKARDMLTEALVQAQKHNLTQADALLERIQVLAPDFVPAYVERARLYESRGMLRKAGEQWTQVMNRSMGKPLYEQAAAERQRLARAEIVMSMTRDTPADAGAATGSRLPKRVRIVSIEREKFESNRDYDEMRIVRVNLKPRFSEGDIDTDDFQVVFTFYDRDVESGAVAPSRAVVPESPGRVEGVWRANDQKTCTAAYIVSKGFRTEEKEETGRRYAYEGVRIQVYYRNQLQDEDAVPKSLMALEAPPPPSKEDDLDKPVGR
jgi:predicted component of type VI protein secretion system